MPSIALIGPGALGGVIAASLARAGHRDLVICARRPVNEFHVQLLDGEVVLKPRVLLEPGQADKVVDWVLVATKAYDAASAATWFPGLVGTGTRVAIIQNGVEHRERFAPWLAAEQILPVMIDLPAERSAPDRIVQRGPGRMAVPAGAAGAAFVALFAGSGIETSEATDFRSVVWRKLCLNSIGAINALVLRPTGIFREEAVGRLAEEMVRESMAVARAEGAVLDDDLPAFILAANRKAPPDSLNSLHADRAAGRPMETDARNGAIVRFGRKHGIPTPLNEMAAILLDSVSTAPR